MSVKATGYEIDTINSTIGQPKGCTDYQFLAISPFANVIGATVKQYSSIYKSSGREGIGFGPQVA